MDINRPQLASILILSAMKVLFSGMIRLHMVGLLLFLVIYHQPEP